MAQIPDSSQVVLHIWPGKWNLPSIDPSCLAAVLFLQLAIPGQFYISECTNPDLSPTGQLPFLTHLHHTIAPLPSILKYISARHPSESTATAPNLDASLNAADKSQQVAWLAHTESTLGDLVAHMFYSLNANWFRLTLPALANMLPLPQRYYVPARIRESYRPRLEAAELWNLPGIEQEEEVKTWFGEKPKAEKDSDHKEQFKKVFERERVLEKARSALDMYTRLLGENRFFFNDRPTSLDVYLASYILLLIDAPFPDPLLQSLLTESYPTLIAHARLVQLQAFPTSGSDIPLLPPQSHTIRSLFPWPTSRQAPKSNAKTDDEIRFQRMRWGWIALAVFSATFYIAQSGVVEVVRNLNFAGEDEELEEYKDEDENED